MNSTDHTILRSLSAATAHESSFGLRVPIDPDTSHSRILFPFGSVSDAIQHFVRAFGFILFEGAGIVDTIPRLCTKQVPFARLKRNLFWHNDNKGTLLLYYPHGSSRPCDIVIGRKLSILRSLISAISELQDLTPSFSDAIQRIVQSLNHTDPSDVSVGFRNLAFLRNAAEYDYDIFRTMNYQVNTCIDDIVRIPIVEHSSQILFIQDTLPGPTCHGRLFNHLQATSFKNSPPDLPYFHLSGGDVAGYTAS